MTRNDCYSPIDHEGRLQRQAQRTHDAGPTRHEPCALLPRQLLPHPVTEAGLAHRVLAWLSGATHAQRGTGGTEALGTHHVLFIAFLSHSSTCCFHTSCSAAFCNWNCASDGEEFPGDGLELLHHRPHRIDSIFMARSAFLCVKTKHVIWIGKILMSLFSNRT